MDFKEVVLIYKKYVEPFIAIFVLIGLSYSVFMLYQNHQLQKDIALECGWAEEDTRCYCERSEVIAWENQIRGIDPEVILDVDMGK